MSCFNNVLLPHPLGPQSTMGFALILPEKYEICLKKVLALIKISTAAQEVLGTFKIATCTIYYYKSNTGQVLYSNFNIMYRYNP